MSEATRGSYGSATYGTSTYYVSISFSRVVDVLSSSEFQATRSILRRSTTSISSESTLSAEYITISFVGRDPRTLVHVSASNRTALVPFRSA